MHGNCRTACIFNDLCDLYSIDMIIVKSFPDLHRYRLFDCFRHCRYDLMYQLRILHKCRTFAVPYYLRNRTSHIDVQDLERQLFNHFRHLAHDLWIGTKEL